jgi:hypothetical protein
MYNSTRHRIHHRMYRRMYNISRCTDSYRRFAPFARYHTCGTSRYRTRAA